MRSGMKIFIIVIVVFLAWQFLGGIVIATSQETIRGKIGEVWNQIDRGEQLLPRLEDQLIYAYKDRQILIDKITAARSAVDNARKSGTNDDLSKAADSMSLALRAFAEAPVPELTELQMGLLDETAGTLNRITYARGELINNQVSFNQKRIVFFFIGLLFPHQQVLGSTFNPETQLSPSKLGTQ